MVFRFIKIWCASHFVNVSLAKCVTTTWIFQENVWVFNFFFLFLKVTMLWKSWLFRLESVTTTNANSKKLLQISQLWCSRWNSNQYWGTECRLQFNFQCSQLNLLSKFSFRAATTKWANLLIAICHWLWQLLFWCRYSQSLEYC